MTTADFSVDRSKPVDPNEPAPVASPIVPVQLTLDEKFQFRCHKGIACFNKCCENIDIMLTPYDVLRLKKRFGVSAREFIENETVDFTMDGQGMPGLKLRMRQGSTQCVNLTPDGCGVYEDRPAACRYYALGMASMRRKESAVDEDSYFVVKEAHCLGHQEPHMQTVREYRRDQGIEDYDDINREWRQIVLKKRSSGPTVGKPSERSFELFFLVSYDIDGFRDFVASSSFGEVFELDDAFKQELMQDDVKLLRFGFRLLKQVLYGECSIPIKADAAEKRAQRYRERQAAMAANKSKTLLDAQDRIYDSLDEGPSVPKS